MLTHVHSVHRGSMKPGPSFGAGATAYFSDKTGLPGAKEMS